MNEMTEINDNTTGTESKFNSTQSTSGMTNYEMLLDDVRRFSYAKVANSMATQIASWTDDNCQLVLNKLTDDDYQMVFDMSSLKMLNGQLQVYMEDRAANEELIQKTILNKEPDGINTGSAN